MGRKRGRKRKSNNDRNRPNTSQHHTGFVPPVGDKSKNTRKGKEGEIYKSIPKKQR